MLVYKFASVYMTLKLDIVHENLSKLLIFGCTIVNSNLFIIDENSKILPYTCIYAALLQTSIHNVTKICKPLVVYQFNAMMLYLSLAVATPYDKKQYNYHNAFLQPYNAFYSPPPSRQTNIWKNDI